ncbi:MAG: WYL domain-containing protein [Eubacterium sp.]|nr:WYL domain-containing protein [Eubacterium sp.]
MAVQDTKLRLLFIWQILSEETDEDHLLSASDLLDLLYRRHDVKADRRSVYSDIDTLKEFGVDIVTVKGNDHGYYIAGRDFELAELKVLADSVQVSKFITRKKSEDLIKKLKLLTSVHQGKQLQKQITLLGRPKATNETIFYNVDAIHSAIYKNRQITFQYAEWNMKKTLSVKKDGALYQVSPWALVWDDENYYLIAYDHITEEERHYRVDKIKNIEMLDEEREGQKAIQKFDAADFGKRTFGMFTGETTDVVITAPNSMVGIFLDRFGRDIILVPDGKDRFHVSLPVTVSQQFFGWISALGNEVKILRPDAVKIKYKQYLKDILAEYEA